MSVDTWLCAAIFLLTLGLIARMATRGLADVITLTVLSFGLFYGFRAVLLAGGLDTPSPGYLFPSATLDADFDRAVLGAVVFLAALGLGVYAATRPRVSGFAPFFVTRTPSPDRQLRAVLALTAVSAMVSAYLLARFGGPGSVIAAAKFDKALAGLYSLRVFAAVGTVVAAGAFVDLVAIRGRRGAAAVCLGCAAANGFSVFLWGSRGLIVVALLVVVIGIGRGRRRAGASRLREVGVAAMVAILVVGAAVTLRVARDNLTHGETQSTVADASLWRQASLSTNSVYLDAAILAFRDVPDTYPSRDGEDFLNGAVGFVPGALWPGKPINIPAGSWFRRQYEPNVVNGWPMGAPALWYVNFGWGGVPLGGLLSGLAVGLIAARQRRTPDNGHNLAVAAAVSIFVFGLGWDNETPVFIAEWLVPLAALRLYLERPTVRVRARSTRPRALTRVRT